MTTRPRSPDRTAAIVATVEDCLREGFTPPGTGGGRGSAIQEAARRMGANPTTLLSTIRSEEQKHRANEPALVPNWEMYAPPDETARIIGASGHTLKGVSILTDANGDEKGRWTKTGRAGRDDEDVPHLPDPKLISKISTLYDQDGKVTQQWIAEKPAEREREALWLAAAEALAEGLPAREPTAPPDAALSADLMAVYPVGDHHFGMLSWAKETGTDYDILIAERLLRGATGRLISIAPACQRAALLFLGDLLHFDSFSAVTPTSRNLLDADTRFPKIVGVVMNTVQLMIELALERHAEVLVIIVPGNHDPASTVFLQMAFARIYANEPRVTVDTSPSGFHYFDHGKVLVGAYHGHDVKMEKLPLIMAADMPEAWGRAIYRYWYTGHIHHAKSQTQIGSQDFSGCTVESFRVLAAADAWSHHKGYRSLRDMKLIVLHREYGEVERHTVNPRMLAAADDIKRAA